MAGSSETLSVQEHSAQSSLLAIKQSQNLVLDLDPFKYDSFMLLIVECQKYSPLVNALTRFETIPMSLLSKAYSSASYIKEKQRITFVVLDKKTFIMKSRFCSLLGITQDDSMVDPDSISITATMEMFYQMGYKETLTLI